MSGIVGGNLGRGSGLVKAGAIDDNSVTLAKMAGGTDGNIISYDASGDPAAIATGDDGQVLTSAGSGQPPAFETLSAGGDLSFGGDTFGEDKTIGSNDTYALSFETDGNEAMKIDTIGAITKPLNPCFVVYANADQVIDNYAGNTIEWGGETTDIGSNFASDVFTAPVAGKYLFSIKMMLEGLADGGWVKVTMRPTGQQYVYIASGNGEYYYNVSFTEIATMAASDTFDVQYVCSANTTTIKGVAGSSYKHTSLSGRLIQ